MSVDVLLIPGLWNSGPDHWQTHWERTRTDCRRVVQTDWETPARVDWVSTLDRAVRESPRPVILAAHSLACATVAHWAATAAPETLGQVVGALLVAPSDVEIPKYPTGVSGFKPMPLAPLPFRSLVVLSTDDEWVSTERGRAFAAAWGSRVAEVGPKGHINSASGLGAWPEGQALLAELAAG
ncbi:MAG: alpha/beta hydrolase [Gemmatirosa sp.]|nr:alpha/beta hydrolase [Gemmatirosa sp.]